MRGSSTETIVVLGQPLQLTVDAWPLERLHLDPTNPRLQTYLTAARERDTTPTEEEIESLLWSREEVRKLYRGILTSGGLSEGLYILRGGRVIEGNERLVALRQVKVALESGEPLVQRENLTRLIAAVPVRILPPNVSQAEVDVLLARIHVGGRAPWDAFAQAAHVYKLFDDHSLSVEQIATALRKSKPWVYQKLQAYKWTLGYLRKYGWDRVRDYSFFEELYKVRAKLKDVGLDVDTEEGLGLFYKLVREESLTWALDVRKLPKLLQNPETRALVFKGRATAALAKLAALDPSAASPRFAALARAREQIDKLTIADLELLRTNDRYRQFIVEFRDSLTSLLRRVG